MYERDIDPYEELTDDLCNYLEAHPWHCETRSSESVDPLDDDDGLDDDVPNVRHTPYCPMDTLDALELCGRLADDLANGRPVSRDKAVMAAGKAVKCLEKYNYELQEWFINAREAATMREVNEIGTDDKPRDPTADEGLGDQCDGEETTGA